MAKCDHNRFDFLCNINRVSTDSEGKDVQGYVVEMMVKCVECGEFFEFTGLPVSGSFTEPCTDPSAITVRLPMRPQQGGKATTQMYIIQSDNTIN